MIGGTVITGGCVIGGIVTTGGCVLGGVVVDGPVRGGIVAIGGCVFGGNDTPGGCTEGSVVSIDGIDAIGGAAVLGTSIGSEPEPPQAAMVLLETTINTALTKLQY